MWPPALQVPIRKLPHQLTAIVRCSGFATRLRLGIVDFLQQHVAAASPLQQPQTERPGDYKHRAPSASLPGLNRRTSHPAAELFLVQGSSQKNQSMVLSLYIAD